MQHAKKKASFSLMDLVIILLILIFCFLCVTPFLVAVSASFSDERTLLRNGYGFLPQDFSTAAYEMLFSTSQIFDSYKVSIFVTIVGTLLSMVVTAMMAYPLSVKKLKYRGKISFFAYFTMLFNGGLVPTYMLISKYLGLRNTVWVMILPVLVNPWNLFLLRNFFSAIPAELHESARIDGANDVRILWQIILPVSLPAIATVSLFYGVAYWNSWYNAMLYIEDSTLFPLQYLIMRMMRNIELMKQMAGQAGVVVDMASMPSTTTRMATAIVTIGPIIIAYPFAQKYFTSGLIVGSVKG
ncbi:MAG: carbohydrate ABC transporter permease [Clostridia bacterium]|nr:carbohydrate ABC transporter permease [Clostridia bacterium]